MAMMKYVVPLNTLSMKDIHIAGGKNASLGEMISQLSQAGIKVPGGFATTADAYWEFLKQYQLDQKIEEKLSTLDVDDVKALSQIGRDIRQWIIDTPLQATLAQEISQAYAQMAVDIGHEFTLAVRSSATAEDLPDASFAGQQETFLNIHGLANLLLAVKHVFASLYNDRAIAYRIHQGFKHCDVALSAGIQQMIRSDLAASGVMFTLDTESGFDQAVFITSSYGLGEMIVQGAVNPDEFYVYKPSIQNQKKAILQKHLGEKAERMVYADDTTVTQSIKTESVLLSQRKQFSMSDAEAEQLARLAMTIEQHYGKPMDIEWAKDGLDQQLYIVQARPETVKSKTGNVLERYHLVQKSNVIISGRSIGQRIGHGIAKIIMNATEMDLIQPGDVLVTDMTDPDWEPIMKKAAAIVTNRGGRTCHAAIIARELGVPAIVGCQQATDDIKNNTPITISCAEGDTGYVYEGLLDYELKTISMDSLPETPVKIMMNVGNPSRAFDFSAIPNYGVGLARIEFVINQMIGIHPKALLEFNQQSAELQTTILDKISGYPDPLTFYIDKLAEGVATIGAAFAPDVVIVRLSDFKSNEYANLIGGDRYEPTEENPMLGFRGASRYVSEQFRDCFGLECEAIKKVRNQMGLNNVHIMIPFVRTVEEAKNVISLLETNGLKRGDQGLKVMMMCEIPSNVLLADEFLQYFDGFSIGSNDLTQLTLGLDRDSAIVADQFDERNDAVKILLHQAIQACKKAGKYIGICGQGPSDHPDLADWLVNEGIDTISLNPDTVIETWLYLAEKHQQ